MKLWLVRHARPLIDAGVCYGATDMAADAQATLASAQALAQTLPQGLHVICSPLQRCEQLALCLIGLRPDLILQRDPRLVEMDFGCWEGWRWSDIPKAALDAWTADFPRLRFGGRESVQDLMQRVAAARLDTERMANEAVWLTHAGVIRAVALQAQGMVRIERADQWPKEAPGFGSWQELQLSGPTSSVA